MAGAVSDERRCINVNKRHLSKDIAIFDMICRNTGNCFAYSLLPQPLMDVVFVPHMLDKSLLVESLSLLGQGYWTTFSSNDKAIRAFSSLITLYHLLGE